MENIEVGELLKLKLGGGDKLCVESMPINAIKLEVIGITKVTNLLLRKKECGGLDSGYEQRVHHF